MNHRRWLAGVAAASIGIGAGVACQRAPARGGAPGDGSSGSAEAGARAPSAPPPTDYLKDLGWVSRTLSATLGPKAKIFELTLMPKQVLVQVEEASRPGYVSRYALRAGRVEPVGPGEIQGAVPEELEARTLELGAIDLSVVPGMIAAAMKSLGFERARVAHVTLRRDDPRDTDAGQPLVWDARWRVWVSSVHGTDPVTFDLAGHVVKTDELE